MTTVDLHGRPETNNTVRNVTLDSYVQTVVIEINKLDHKIVLVGHSLAGAVISLVAEQIPEKIEKLVYVAAFLLGDGDSILAAMQRDPDGEFLPELVFSEDQSEATAKEQTWRSKAFHDVEEACILEALPLVDVPQATETFLAKQQVGARKLGTVPKVYVRTAIDRMVSPRLQDEMLKNWPVEQVHTLQAGHFPTLSLPETLAELLL